MSMEANSFNQLVTGLKSDSKRSGENFEISNTTYYTM